MDKIKNCDYVIIILSAAYFESKYCVYEAYLSEKYQKKIRVIKLADSGISSTEEREIKYKKMLKSSFNVLPDTENTFMQEIGTFEKYEELLIKILNAKTFSLIGENKYGLFKDVYRSIFGIEAQDLNQEEIGSVKNLILHSMDNISNNNLKSELLWLLIDIKRCSYFKTSYYPEDAFGEQKLKFKDYSLLDGHMGAMLKIYATDYNGKEQIIDFYNVQDVECNQESGSNVFQKYYVVVVDEKLYREYEKQMKRPIERRNQDAITAYETKGFQRHRIELFFEDENALDVLNIEKQNISIHI